MMSKERRGKGRERRVKERGREEENERKRKRERERDDGLYQGRSGKAMLIFNAGGWGWREGESNLAVESGVSLLSFSRCWVVLVIGYHSVNKSLLLRDGCLF